MSQRGKRGNRLENENNAHQQQQQPPSKRRKGRPPTGSHYDQQDHEMSAATTIPVVSAGVQPTMASSAASSSTLWQARSITDLKIYNRSSSEAPAELFRKDLISAMKLPDSEPLSTDEYWIITDQWKQEWERGVQVPVNPDSLPEPSVKQLQSPIAASRHDFKLPKNKYLRITKDDNFSAEQHFLSNAPSLAETACSYDLDQVDEVWLKLLNNERALCGAPAVSDGQFERVIEELEVRCWDKIQAIMRDEEGLGIEYDENVICDVCRSPDSEEANEMVFCDNCNICVHQACYGITVIPSGQWLCRTCSMGKKPDCTLCPNKGGAMKSTRSGKKWAHVSCALWIPEVSIGCVDRMEPITKISSIPQSRWSLLCILCRERVGACIQCSVKSCKTAYHVTCAFQHGLEMRAIIEEGNAEDGVKLRSYCLKHCNAKGKKDKGTNNNGVGSGSDDDDCRRRKIRKDMTSEERNQVRLMRLKEVEAEFDKHVNIKDISCHLLDVDQEAISFIHNYWILKRKSGNNRPLIPPKADDVDMISNRQDQADIEKKVMFVHLRQDLERVRNLCYMVNRREKLSRTFFKMREQIFYKQIAILSENLSKSYDESVISAIIQANNGTSVYDKCYSSSSSTSTAMNFDDIQEKIKGMQQFVDSSFENPDPDDKTKKSSRITAYKKIHVNGISDRKTDSVYEDSCMSSNSDAEKFRFSVDAKVKKKTQSYSKILEKHKRRKSFASSIAIDSSSDGDNENTGRSIAPKKNPSLHQMEEELAKDNEELLTSSDDSDLLVPIKHSNNLTSKKSSMPIYSDSDSTDREKTDNTVSDSQQQIIRTKAAMKEFTLQASKHKQDAKKGSPTKCKLPTTHTKYKSPEEGEKRKSKVKQKTQQNDSDIDEVVPEKKEKSQKHKPIENETPKLQSKDTNSKRFQTDLLVVPQRQAAKKASENMRSTNSYVGVTGQKKDVRDVKADEKDNDWNTSKAKEKTKEKEKEKEVRDEEKEKDKDKEKEKEKEKERDKERSKPRGRPPKNSKDEQRDNINKDKKAEVKSPPETVKHDKPISKKADKSDNLIVAYVPQRQAAKKAAEHIKSGMGKSTTSESLQLDDKEKEQPKEKTDKEKEREKGKSEGERDKERGKDKPKERMKPHIQEKDSEKLTFSDKEDEKDEKLVKTEKPDNKKAKDNDSHDEFKKSKSTAKVDKKPTTILLTSASSESSSSSSYSTSSSVDSDNDNEPTVRRKKESLTRSKSKTPERSPTKSVDTLHPVASSKCKIDNVHLSTAKTSDSDVCILDDSPRASGKRRKSNVPSSPRRDSLKESDVLTKERTEPKTTTKTKDRLSDSSLDNYADKSPVSKSSSPKKENIRTLEEEMAQRKADLSSFQMGGFKSNPNKNTGSLDKLLNRKEKERQAQECPEKEIEIMELDDSLKSVKDIDEKIKSAEQKKANDLQDILRLNDETAAEIIDIDSESVESIRSKSNQFPGDNQRNEDEDMKSLPTFALSTFLPDQNEDSAARTQEKSPNPVLDKEPEMISLQQQPQQSSDEVLSNKNTTDLPVEPIFEAKCNAEDSARETMNLVEKLRQKYKRSSSSSLKNDDLLTPGDIKDVETKSNTSSFNFSFDVFPPNEKIFDKQAKDVSSIFEKDVPKIDPATVKVPFEPQTADSAIVFFEKNRHLCDITRSSQVKEMDIEKDEEAFQEPKTIEKAPLTIAKQTDSFDTLSQSNFFKHDFVETESLNMNTNSSKIVVDSEYDENTRMQSPYANPANIWNENNLIQTRRSVSSSPSSISESNDEIKLKVNVLSVDKSVDERHQHEKQQQLQQQQQQQHHHHHQLSTISCDTQNVDKNNFNIVSSFEMLPSQFQMQQQQQHQQHQPGQLHPPPTTHSGLNGVEIMSYNFSGNNHYNGPVSLFPVQSVTNMNAQMPFPSPATPIFPSALSGTMPLSQNAQSDTSIFGHIGNKHSQSSESNITYPILCGAAFTSSSDNLALTTAIVTNNVASVPISSSQILNNTYNLSADNNIVNNPDTNTLNNIMNDVISNNNINMKDSPSKRTSARFNQIKSPSMHKSPGKSPRNLEILGRPSHGSQKLKCDPNQSRTKNNRSSRGASSSRARGRRGRTSRLVLGSQMPPNMDFEREMNSIQSNLVGTVYDLDFDEDLAVNVENLKSLRDSRRSFDCRSNAGNSSEQKFTSPSYHGKLRNAVVSKSVTDSKPPSLHSESDLHPHSMLHNIHPVLPGPVNMGTYNLGYENQATSQEPYNHLLGAFASGMADQTLNEIDEEVEKELQSALKASGTYKSKPQPISDTTLTESHVSIETTSEEISIDSDNTISKVSLSDSRNQLKLKIKGPLACPDNYNTQSSCVSLNQNLNSDNLGLQITSATSAAFSSASNTTGTSSLRRMRKKELLRQYWTQDMNMGDATPPTAENKTNCDPILNRSVGIPKAIDSMGTIPTKDDDLPDIMDPKWKRKRITGLSRELRQLDMPYDTERPERRRSGCSSGSNISVNNVGGDSMKVSKRRGKNKIDSPSHAEPPKIKIKIGGHDTLSDRMLGCPPKKRLAASLVVPSLEILKRDCMNYRKQVMADFNEDEEIVKKPKIKTKKNNKASHKKRKKEKRNEIQIIENSSTDTPKLIIRIGKRKAQDSTQSTSGDAAEPARDNNDELTESNSNAEPGANMMPIKLKIARNSDGGGYVIGDRKHPDSDQSTDPANDITKKSDDELHEVTPTLSSAVAANSSSSSSSGATTATSVSTDAKNSESSSSTTLNLVSAHNKVNNDLKGQVKTSKSCPLLPLNKDCEVR